MITGLVAYLLAQPSLTAITSQVAPVPLLETTPLPAITFQQVSYTTGYSPQPDGVSKSRMVFDCFGASYADAANLAQAVKAVLSGYNGTLTDGTLVYLIEIVNVADAYVDHSRIYRTSVHAMVMYAE